MASFRLSVAGLFLAVRCWAAPTAAQKDWALATSAILNEISGGKHHEVLGEKTAREIANDQRLLIDYWGVRSRADLLHQIQSLGQDHQTKLTAGWDYPRAIMLARRGYIVDYLTEDEAWSYIWPLAQRIRRGRTGARLTSKRARPGTKVRRTVESSQSMHT